MNFIKKCSNKKKWCITSIVLVLVISMCFIIFYLQDRSNSQVNHVQEEVVSIDELMDFSYTTMKVTDYEQKADSGTYVEWETRYSLVTSESTLYVNNQLKDYKLKTPNLEEAVTFDPENLTGKYDFNEEMDKNDTGILYEFTRKESEEYVASLLQQGHKLRRKVLSPSYAEVYLLNNENKTIRVLVFQERMLTAELEKNELSAIESYFE